MAIKGTNQYRPLSTNETGTNAPLSVRQRDQWEGINNYARTPWPLQPSTAFPGTNTGNDISLESAATTGEQLVLASGRIYVPNQYDLIRWHCCHIATANADAARTVVWKLYVSDNRYDGPVAFDSTILSFSDSDSVSTAYPDLTTDSIYVCSDANRITIPRLTYASEDWPVYFTLTATSSDGTIRARLYTLGITAEVGWMT